LKFLKKKTGEPVIEENKSIRVFKVLFPPTPKPKKHKFMDHRGDCRKKTIRRINKRTG